MSEKPNVIFWTLVLVGVVSVFLFIYSLVVQMSQDTPLFARHNLSEELLMISCLLNIVQVILRFGHKKHELFGPWKDPEAPGNSSIKSGTF
jgi:hypothetical protein